MKTKAKVLIVGGDSQVGSHLAGILKTKEFDVTLTSRRSSKLVPPTLFFDLDPKNEINIDGSYDFAVICVGVTSVKKCETDPGDSYNLNVVSTINLINKLIGRNTFVIYLSSNLVFSGKKAFYSIKDEPDPICNYGKFKLEIEKLLQNHGVNRYAVLRMTKVLTPGTKIQFAWQKEISEGKNVALFTNVYLAPVGIDEASETILTILRSSKSGVFQISSLNEISYYDFGTRWAIENHFDPKLIIPTVNLDPTQSKHNSLVRNLPI